MWVAAFAAFTLTISTDPKELDLAHNVEMTLADIAIPGVEITGVDYMKCGQVNAAYIPVIGEIIICDELGRESAGMQRFAVAHEYGHAVIHQLHLPIVGSEEVAADEFAEMALTLTGHQQDLADAAAFYAFSAQPEDPSDDHPSDIRRMYTFECMLDGVQKVPSVPQCAAYARRVYDSWARLLAPAFAD